MNKFVYSLYAMLKLYFDQPKAFLK